MKEIMPRVSSRIRGKRWLPSVSTMTRTHTIVIVHFNTDTRSKNEVACIHESIFTSISTHIYIHYKWENPIMYIWTRGPRKECAFCGRGSTNKSCNVNVSTTSFSAQTILGFVHVNSIINFVNLMVLGGCVPLSFIGVFYDIVRYDYKHIFFPWTEINPETWENCYHVSLCCFSSTDSPHVPLIFPKKKSPPLLTIICTMKGVCGTKKLL